MKTVALQRLSPPSTILKVKYCKSFYSKSIGLMFAKQIDMDKGVILVNKHPSRINSAIHMLFMNYDLTVLWLDKELVIVDKILAKRWMPFYFPKFPAQYVLELHSTKLNEYQVGEKLIRIDKNSA